MSQAAGAVLLGVSTICFILFTVWIIFTPFLDVVVVSNYFPPREWATTFGVFLFVAWSSLIMFSLGYILTKDGSQHEHPRTNKGTRTKSKTRKTTRS